MAADKTDLKWIVVFRTAASKAIYDELKAGRLRQGWGRSGLALLDVNGEKVGKAEWEKKHVAIWGPPKPKRHSGLMTMLKIEKGDIVVLPKQPVTNQFSIARVTGEYRFEKDNLLDGDLGHVIPVDRDSVRTFNVRADTDAYTVSSLFSRANHMSPVTFARDQSHIRAAGKLLEKADNPVADANIVEAALDDAIRSAAKAMQEEIQKWNGKRFEETVKKVFEKEGYILESYRTYNRKGGDADMVVSPPSKNYSLFMPGKIAVQVKWKKKVDQQDIKAVEQLLAWDEIKDEPVKKFVISSADRFTGACKERAEAEDVTLIGGLNTMYFLMGIDRVDDTD